jgi:hypothetical protein
VFIRSQIPDRETYRSEMTLLGLQGGLISILKNRHGGRKGTAASNSIKTTKFESKNEVVVMIV